MKLHSFLNFNKKGLFILMGSAFLFACQENKQHTDQAQHSKQEGTQNSQEKLSSPYRIVTTCTMVTDIVKQVAGDQATVQGLMGPGVDPHLYKPTRDDLILLTDADVIFYSGLMLEGRMGDAFVRAGREGVKAYAVTDLLEEGVLLEPEEFDGHWDPHVWNDVQAWMSATRSVSRALSELDPKNAEKYEQNAKRYLAQLEELDEYAKRCLATVPKSSRVLITNHDAFNYFARAYDFQVKAVQGVTTEAEASIKDMNELVDFIIKHKIQAVFVENISSDRNMKSVLGKAQARGHTVNIGGQLFSDATGAKGSYEGTYIGMIDHNVTCITRALGGEAPVKGLHGRLGDH